MGAGAAGGIADVLAGGAYRVDDATTVKFEIEPLEGFRSAGPEEIPGRVREAVGPAVEAAKAVLVKVKDARSDEVEQRFGIKVTGGANWLVAKAAGEGNFEIFPELRLASRCRRGWCGRLGM